MATAKAQIQNVRVKLDELSKLCLDIKPKTKVGDISTDSAELNHAKRCIRFSRYWSAKMLSELSESITTDLYSGPKPENWDEITNQAKITYLINELTDLAELTKMINVSSEPVVSPVSKEFTLSRTNTYLYQLEASWWLTEERTRITA